VRIDSGVREGDAISPFYDPMIAKLIVWGADRKQALARMAQALSQYQIVGLATNIAFLKRLVEGSAFSTADLDTGLIERNHAALFPAAQAAPNGALALAAVALIEAEKVRAAAQSGANAADPWGKSPGWRMNRPMPARCRSAMNSQPRCRRKAMRSCHLPLPGTGCSAPPASQPEVLSLMSREGNDYSIKLGEQAVHGTVRRDGDVFHVFSNGTHYHLDWNDPMAHAGEAEAEGGRLTAPMPGKVVAVLAAKGQEVKKGDALVIMEAMKMEHTIAAPQRRCGRRYSLQVGDQVADGAPLLAFKTA
jgi:3-methylcrotonyl-CoA carboxylase alpha subunit